MERGPDVVVVGAGVAGLICAVELAADGDGDGELKPLVLPATNRRGRRIECRVACSPLRGSAKENRGVILLMESRDGKDGSGGGGDGK